MLYVYDITSYEIMQLDYCEKGRYTMQFSSFQVLQT